ncbi:hypothetical protein C518_3003 [Lysinibacillus fusiformis ZB2]|nr:hypothetical protein C518_3003 [Lysinibacillus fusiformis ZB2]
MKLTDYLKELNEGKKIKPTANLGYVYAPNCIRRCLRLSQEEKLVLFEIYSLYNEEKGCAFPTQQTLAMYVGVSSSSISKALKRLEEKDFIKSYGAKGKKKRYIPSFSLHGNPYLVLSETFHFASKVISKYIPEELCGAWGNKLLSLVNVKKEHEFSEIDMYGNFIKSFNTNTTSSELIAFIEQYICDTYCIKLDIDWKEEIKKSQKEKTVTATPTRQYRKQQKSGFNLPQNEHEREQHEAWLKQMGIEDF